MNLASCLSIDLPGCGLSAFDPKLPWDAYTVDALAELVGKVIEDYREKDMQQGVVLIGHSLGCSIAALLASTTSPQSIALSENVMGLVVRNQIICKVYCGSLIKNLGNLPSRGTP